MFRFTCCDCGVRLRTREDPRHRQVRCPACLRVFEFSEVCVLCKRRSSNGIFLNDRSSFLCEHCRSELACTIYPEKYEKLRRELEAATETRRLAWKSFTKTHEYRPRGPVLLVLGLYSLLLIFFHTGFIILTGILLLAACIAAVLDRSGTRKWLERKTSWERSNPVPQVPVLKHFHDPSAEMTERDLIVRHILELWPEEPPFWAYLRGLVLARDGNRCQVTGCPSLLPLHIHHKKPRFRGGRHRPDNLVTLCAFHHALEPDRGHERVWGDVKSERFTLVRQHERSNPGGVGTHVVRAHVRRRQLVRLDELYALKETYGFCCPSCRGSQLQLRMPANGNTVVARCPACGEEVQGPRQLTEETGPRLAEILHVTRRVGSWKARWDALAEKTASDWEA